MNHWFQTVLKIAEQDVNLVTIVFIAAMKPPSVCSGYIKKNSKYCWRDIYYSIPEQQALVLDLVLSILLIFLKNLFPMPPSNAMNENFNSKEN